MSNLFKIVILSTLSMNLFADELPTIINEQRVCYYENLSRFSNNGTVEMRKSRNRQESEIRKIIDKDGKQSISINSKSYFKKHDGNIVLSTTENTFIERKIVTSKDGSITRQFDKVSRTNIIIGDSRVTEGSKVLTMDYERVTDFKTTKEDNREVIASWIDGNKVELPKEIATIDLETPSGKKIMASLTINVSRAPVYYEGAELRLDEDNSNPLWFKTVCETEVLK